MEMLLPEPDKAKTLPMMLDLMMTDGQYELPHPDPICSQEVPKAGAAEAGLHAVSRQCSLMALMAW